MMKLRYYKIIWKERENKKEMKNISYLLFQILKIIIQRKKIK